MFSLLCTLYTHCSTVQLPRSHTGNENYFRPPVNYSIMILLYYIHIRPIAEKKRIQRDLYLGTPTSNPGSVELQNKKSLTP